MIAYLLALFAGVLAGFGMGEDNAFITLIGAVGIVISLVLEK